MGLNTKVKKKKKSSGLEIKKPIYCPKLGVEPGRGVPARK